MTPLALASMFTGAVIFAWGLRALRNHRVKVLHFKMRSGMSTMIFGLVSMFCGLLMIIAGPAATSPPTAELADLMVKFALYLFGVGWAIALVLEALARSGSKLLPEETPVEYRGKLKRWARTQAEADRPAGAGRIASSRRLLQTAMRMFVTAGSRLYHRVMLPPRSWDKQNLWHPAEDHEKRSRQKAQTAAALEHDERQRESRRSSDADGQ